MTSLATPLASPWPAVSLDEATRILTAPGAPFEMETLIIRGIHTRVWKNIPSSLGTLIEESRRHGNRAFFVCGEERVSYVAHHRAVAALARWLVDQGVGKGDRVALAMRNLPEWPVIFFAATAIGAIIVPLNAWWTGGELAACLDDCKPLLMFCDAERCARVGGMAEGPRLVVSRAQQDGDFTALETIIGDVGSYDSLPDAELPPTNVEPDDDATIFYTSGTTGRPKGALATHRNVLSNIQSSSFAAARNFIRRGEPLPPAAPKVRLITVPLFHVTACSASMITGIPAGNTNIVMRRWDAAEALAIIERERVQITGGVPTIAWQLVEHPARTSHDISSLESVAYGGAPAAPALARLVTEELGTTAGNGWGMTETTGTVTSHSAEEYLARPDSCGPPVATADLRIMDEAGLRQLPLGTVGELWARGPMVARGYWERPIETAATFVDGWVRTGDLARLDEEGFCFIVDRCKDVVIRGGENIYSIEVENTLFAHPAVSETALIGIPHPTLGEEPAAVVHLVSGLDASEAELRQWVRDRLAGFKVPVRILFLPEPLPRNAAGKTLKSALRPLFEEIG